VACWTSPSSKRAGYPIPLPEISSDVGLI
jgi:hypothetical protein